MQQFLLAFRTDGPGVDPGLNLADGLFDHTRAVIQLQDNGQCQFSKA
jgi:hypothetical protein